jgi:hypothetical protein
MTRTGASVNNSVIACLESGRGCLLAPAKTGSKTNRLNPKPKNYDENSTLLQPASVCWCALTNASNKSLKHKCSHTQPIISNSL